MLIILKEANINTMKLSQCKTKQMVKVTAIEAGKNALINLNKMGIKIGDTILIKNKSLIKGPILVRCNDTEIAIGNRIADKIIVELESQS